MLVSPAGQVCEPDATKERAMPYGEVTEFDTSTGIGRIDTSTGWYEVHRDDMDNKARTKHAKVDFDVERTAEGQDRAVNVVLRGGTRNNPEQRRFGDDG
jgi:hypothetical protein